MSPQLASFFFILFRPSYTTKDGVQIDWEAIADQLESFPQDKMNISTAEKVGVGFMKQREGLKRSSTFWSNWSTAPAIEEPERSQKPEKDGAFHSAHIYNYFLFHYKYIQCMIVKT